VGVIVAHPDDETLWAGGAILMHPDWRCRILSVSRASDPDRAPRFHNALTYLGASGDMADLDDGAEQTSLTESKIRETIAAFAAGDTYDLLLTHGPNGEYTFHQRHIEVSHAVLHLWKSGVLRAGRLWRFAYEDGNGAYLPRAEPDADIQFDLPEEIWSLKRFIVTAIYGFSADSWEAQALPRVEAFRELVLGAV
jgi:LmbE family N-acetylglucosaminyl deacetylase